MDSHEHALQAIPICENVYWVGAMDWTIRDFHGYMTSRGSSYNAFLILGEKITLIDTVKRPFLDVLMARIRSVIDPEKIDYIVSNHSELDHSGSLPEVIALTKPEKVFASKMGVKSLNEHFHNRLPLTEVADGETLDLGGLHLMFMETRMLHWPDSMFTYLPERALLFSQDAFGMHLASNERFDTEIPEEILRWEAAKYYANIVMPYSHQVVKLIDKVKNSDLKIDMIATDHGPVWTEKRRWIIDLYDMWGHQKPTNKVVVVYDTMWGSTEKMARSFSDGVLQGGAKCVTMPLGSHHRSDVATEILECGGLAVGTPTLNNMMYPTIADTLCYLRGLKPKNLLAAAFGSYGWSGEGDKQVRAELETMKLELVDDNVRVKYVPTPDNQLEAMRLGKKMAIMLKEKLQTNI